MTRRTISLDDDMWGMIDAMCNLRQISDSELIGALLTKVAGFENLSTDFNAPVKNVLIGDGSVIEGDKVGGNVDRSQGKILFNDTTVTGDVTNTSNNTIYCDKVELVLEDGSNYSLLVDEKPVELKLERIAHPQAKPWPNNNQPRDNNVMHAKPDLRVLFEVEVTSSGSVITAVIPPGVRRADMIEKCGFHVRWNAAIATGMLGSRGLSVSKVASIGKGFCDTLDGSQCETKHSVWICAVGHALCPVRDMLDFVGATC